MTSRSSRIRRIVEIQKLMENKAVADMNRARRKLDGARNLHQHLSLHGADYEQQGEGGRGRSTAGLYHRYRSFLARLNQAIVQQERQIELDRHQVGLSEAKWRRQRVEGKAVEAFLDRVVQTESRQLEQREKRQDDDLYARRRIAGVMR